MDMKDMSYYGHERRDLLEIVPSVHRDNGTKFLSIPVESSWTEIINRRR
jgi:hypothetical protein